MSEQIDHKHSWIIRFDGNFNSETFGDISAVCFSHNCQARMTREKIQDWLNIADVVDAEIADLEAEIERLQEDRINKLAMLDSALEDARVENMALKTENEQLKGECAGLELMQAEGAEFNPCDDCEYRKQIELLNKVDEFLR